MKRKDSVVVLLNYLSNHKNVAILGRVYETVDSNSSFVCRCGFLS